jgi:hypothetical protein
MNVSIRGKCRFTALKHIGAHRGCSEQCGRAYLNDRPVLIPRSVTRSLRMVQPSTRVAGREASWDAATTSAISCTLLLLSFHGSKMLLATVRSRIVVVAPPQSCAHILGG